MKAIYCRTRKTNYLEEGDVHIDVFVKTKNDKANRKVSFEINFDCIPHLRAQLRGLWNESRKREIERINDLDKAVGILNP